MNDLATQAISVLAALVLLIAFGLLAQRRMLGLLRLYALQGVVLAGAAGLVGYVSGSHELYLSALLTLLLKGIVLPAWLWRIIVRLHVEREVETLVNIPATLLIGTGLVIFSYFVAAPVSELSTLVTRNTLAIALSGVLLGMLMMITRKKAITQVIGFLAMENALFFAATAATYGMPMIVELGVAFDVLMAAIIFGIFFFQISTTFQSLDLDKLTHLREEGDSE